MFQLKNLTVTSGNRRKAMPIFDKSSFEIPNQTIAQVSKRRKKYMIKYITEARDIHRKHTVTIIMYRHDQNSPQGKNRSYSSIKYVQEVSITYSKWLSIIKVDIKSMCDMCNLY